MNILIAPNAFKGSLSSLKASLIIDKTVKQFFMNKVKTELMPVADGGDGLIDVLKNALGGKIVQVRVHDAVGRLISSEYCVLQDNSAVIEIAKACGLALMKGRKLRPMQATSFGVGELILAALNRGIKKIYVGLGGSATNDSGSGMAQALGVGLLNKNGDAIGFGVEELLKLCLIDLSRIDNRVKSAEFFAVTDVKNPLLGKYGSARVYGPQKGATPRQVEIMAKALGNYNSVIKKDLEMDAGHLPGGGAAGGIATGLHVFCGAKIVGGAEFVFTLIKAEEKIKKADLIIIGEGCLDSQTFFGKAPCAVSRLAKKFGKPVLFVGGQVKISGGNILIKNGITAACSIMGLGVRLKDSLCNAEKYLPQAVTEGLRVFSSRRHCEEPSRKD